MNPERTDFRGWAQRLAVSMLLVTALISAGSYAVDVILPAAVPDAAAPWTSTRLLYEALMTATGVSIVALGLFVLWGAPVSAASAVFSLYLASLALLAADGARLHLLRKAHAAAGADATLQQRSAVLVFAAALACCLAAGMRWTQLFPRRLARADIAEHTRGGSLRAAQIGLLGPRPAWGTIGLGGFVVFATATLLLERTPAAQGVTPMFVAVAVLMIGTLNLRASYRAGDADERARIFWMLEAGVVASVLSAIAFVVELAVHLFRAGGAVVVWMHAILMPLALLTLVSLLAVAVLYGGAVDSRLVLRKTMLYGVTGIALTALFVAIEGVASELVVARLGLPERAGGWLAGLGVALTFGAVKDRLDRRLGRVMERGGARQPT